MRNKRRPVELTDEEVDQAIEWLSQLKQEGQYPAGMCRGNVSQILRHIMRPGRRSYTRIFDAYNLHFEVKNAVGFGTKPD